MMAEAYSTIDKESPTKAAPGPAPVMVKESKIGPSRYLQDGSLSKNGKQDDLETQGKTKDESISKLSKLEGKISETLQNTLSNIADSPVQEGSTKVASNADLNSVHPVQLRADTSGSPQDSLASRSEKEDSIPSRKKAAPRKASEDNVGGYGEEVDDKPTRQERVEPAEPVKDLSKEEEVIPLRTIASKDGDIFSGLIKKPSHSQEPREITLNSEELSKINAKLYSCISELQLEHMRNKSTRVQNAIKTLEGVRESLFSILSAKK